MVHIYEPYTSHTWPTNLSFSHTQRERHASPENGRRKKSKAKDARVFSRGIYTISVNVSKVRATSRRRRRAASYSRRRQRHEAVYVRRIGVVALCASSRPSSSAAVYPLSPTTYSPSLRVLPSSDVCARWWERERERGRRYGKCLRGGSDVIRNPYVYISIYLRGLELCGRSSVLGARSSRGFGLMAVDLECLHCREEFDYGFYFMLFFYFLFWRWRWWFGVARDWCWTDRVTRCFGLSIHVHLHFRLIVR